MSLKKFTSIQNVGRFHSASASGDVEFRKLTLIYGENGRGKTTLCAILRSLQSGDAGHISGRRTLGSAGQPYVKILLDAPAPLAAFQDGAWTQTLPALAVFDQQYVSENVYLGDGVGADTHPLWRVYQDLDDINDYTSRHHHADGTFTGIVDEGELRGYVKRCLRLVGAMGT